MSHGPNALIDQILANRSLVAAETPQWLDNDRIAFVSTLGGAAELWSIAAGGGFPQRLTAGLGGAAFMASRLMRVSPDGRWVAYLSDAGGTTEVWLWPTDSGAARQLTRLGGDILALSWSPDSKAVVLSGSRYGSFDIYRVEVADGRITRLTSDARYEVFPVFTPSGDEVVFVRLDERWAEHDVTAIPARGGAERLIIHDEDFFDYGAGRTFGYPLLSPDGRSVLFRSYRSGYVNYWLAPIQGGEARPLAAEEADQTDAAWAPDGRSVVYGSNRHGTIRLHVADVQGGAPRPLVAPALGVITLPTWSPDGSQIAYLYQTPTAPLDLWVVSLAGGATRQLTNSRLSGAEGYLLTPQKVAYPTFDGRTIEAYLYQPPASQAGQRLPAIIWAHGGPAMQWLDEYYDYMHYFALQGYAVLAPNVRGSTGYGRAFEDLNNADWGYGDLQDVLAGVEYLKTLAGIDPSRMAIAGTSYGGYMAAAAVCFTQNVFQAAISISGYPDRVAMVAEQEKKHLKQMEFKFGPFETHKHIYEKCSPQRWAKQATTPCLVLWGEGRLPRSEGARNFALALEKEYKTVQAKGYQGEGYYVQGLANTRQMWLDMQDFLERYLTSL